MSVRLLYFAWVREKIGVAEEEVDMPDTVHTVSDLVTWLKTRGPEFGEAFAQSQVIRAAIDRTQARPGADVRKAKEIAFFPPVTGG